MHFNINHILINHGFKVQPLNDTIYLNLYEAIKNAILSQTLDSKIKLPPSRVLSKDLNISRSTVLKAYDLLVLEKYVTSVTGSGYFINSIKDIKHQKHLPAPVERTKYPKLSKKGLAFKKNVAYIKNNQDKGIAFRPGLPPLDIFPTQLWKNLSNDYWKNVKYSLLSYSNAIGLECLRNNISNYLKIYRGINCNSDQIVITTGSLHSLSLIGEALIDENDKIIIENPTYPLAYNLFKGLKAKIITSKIDSEGIIINTLKAKKPKIIYTTPSNQYPTGVKMSYNRRVELLQWASNNNTFIIEDDYDHEFSNWGNPVSSIFSLDGQDQTIYLGTFNKLLHPSIRIGYMIVPYYLLDTILSIYQHTSRFVSPSLQRTLSSFIEKDYSNKHLRKVIDVSCERKKVFVGAFLENFEKTITLDDENTGLHIIGRLHQDYDDVKLSAYLKKKNIIVHPYSKYFIKGTNENGIVMGYCSVNNKIIKETISKMKTEFNNFVLDS